ncbi:MAG TPA: YdeI/OmpD-associated family protein [Stellaceae bacterium]|jgi:uncharacterized protein YdeI (YjbR/CyaY-like superfamily)
MIPQVDAFFDEAKSWQAEFRKLRTIVLDCGLTEELKWYKPCYTAEGHNIVLIGGFKEYCVLLFFKGALLKDAKGLLSTPGQTQAGRQIRFTGLQDVIDLEPFLKTYIREAVEIDKAGLTVTKKTTGDFAIPEEFQQKLDDMPDLNAAFEALTPGRQRAYLFYFSGAKQPKTREARVEKHIENIMNGKGLDD